MTNDFVEGTVVIVATSQAGTIVGFSSATDVMVLLANGDFWMGMLKQCRIPSDADDLAAAPRDIDRFAIREAPKNKVANKRNREYD